MTPRRSLDALAALVEAANKAPPATEREAFEAGREAGMHGANELTAHYRFFARPELTAAWERGNADGKTARRARRRSK